MWLVWILLGIVIGLLLAVFIMNRAFESVFGKWFGW